MSWSVSLIGTPEKVVAALETFNDGLTGQSRVEWDEAKPHLIELVKQNFITEAYSKMYPQVRQPLVNLYASGSGTSNADGLQLQRNCQVKIEQIHGALI